jgi:hypothetical protein
LTARLDLTKPHYVVIGGNPVPLQVDMQQDEVAVAKPTESVDEDHQEEVPQEELEEVLGQARLAQVVSEFLNHFSPTR